MDDTLHYTLCAFATCFCYSGLILVPAFCPNLFVYIRSIPSTLTALSRSGDLPGWGGGRFRPIPAWIPYPLSPRAFSSVFFLSSVFSLRSFFGFPFGPACHVRWPNRSVNMFQHPWLAPILTHCPASKNAGFPAALVGTCLQCPCSPYLILVPVLVLFRPGPVHRRT